MPTGDEYRQAAKDIEAVGADLGTSFGHIDRPWDDAVQGGRLATTVADAIEASKGLTSSVKGRLQIIADECVRRAGVCDAYDAQLQDYYNQMSAYQQAEANRQPGDPQSPSPTRPHPPEPWVTPSV